MEKRWNDINGKMRVFKKEFEGRTSYSTSLSNKKEDGTYENMYLTVQFKKDNQPNVGEKGLDINIKNGFVSFFKTNDGNTRLKLVITEYTSNDNDGEFLTVSDEELPF